MRISGSSYLWDQDVKTADMVRMNLLHEIAASPPHYYLTSISPCRGKVWEAAGPAAEDLQGHGQGHEQGDDTGGVPGPCRLYRTHTSIYRLYRYIYVHILIHIQDLYKYI